MKKLTLILITAFAVTLALFFMTARHEHLINNDHDGVVDWFGYSHKYQIGFARGYAHSGTNAIIHEKLNFYSLMFVLGDAK